MRQKISVVNRGETALTFSELAGNDSVIAFSTRKGGISRPPLDSLNFSLSQGDSRQNVLENQRIFSAELDVSPREIVTCRQIHSDHVEVLDFIPPSPPEADAMVTSKAGIFLGIRTADCLPILLVEKQRRIAAAVHAGWRGTVLRITRKVVRLMKTRFGCDPEDIVAALGPSIAPCCYEVDEAVLGPFRESIPEPERFITVENHSSPRKSFRLNLALTNSYELRAEGIPEENILSMALCTCCNPDLFFSYRRDGAASGRHMALVGFKT